jgi:RNA polymerase sigma-70 factor (ECF subfamily)
MFDERTAIAQLKRGDIAGLDTLVQHYQVKAVRAAALITGSRAQAEDIVQSAFVTAFQRIDQFDAARPFGPWFLRSVVNAALKAATRGAHQVSLDGDLADALEHLLADPAPGPEAIAEGNLTHEAIHAALEQLSPPQRAAVVMRYYLDLGEVEVNPGAGLRTRHGEMAAPRRETETARMAQAPVGREIVNEVRTHPCPTE